MYIKALFILVTALYSLIISANDSKKINRYGGIIFSSNTACSKLKLFCRSISAISGYSDGFQVCIQFDEKL